MLQKVTTIMVTNGVSFALTPGACILVEFSNVIAHYAYESYVPSTVTLNINSTGAKYLQQQYISSNGKGGTTTTNRVTNTGWILNNTPKPMLLVYTGSYYSVNAASGITMGTYSDYDDSGGDS